MSAGKKMCTLTADDVESRQLCTKSILNHTATGLLSMSHRVVLSPDSEHVCRLIFYPIVGFSSVPNRKRTALNPTATMSGQPRNTCTAEETQTELS